MAQVKGAAVEASMRYVRERFGAESLAQVIRALPVEDRRAFEQVILVSSWYPMASFLRFMQAARQLLGTQEPDIVRQMGRASCEYGISTLYKIFFKVGSPGYIVGRAARVYAAYYDSGELRVVETGPGRAVIELTGLAGGAPEFCERIYGWMERTLELAGAKNLRASHAQCIHTGAPSCRFEGYWD